ncbi:SDR family NAD(P)-dependent oxidoreductase [Nodosilinea sp. PGN35]|uniref:SDR family NAD(P)-dependent oxidoreductase n=1 Tax=Nodosilinea sp. PGN35 TaxID=3020489 RepID=UPI0023B2A3EE|nr:SDR family oxidoreductase [Nodosilinea sp. TSF1-S3]MDF0365402.1 SDR family NAD(P)-dependent oxidoreductase [Nodosilinea sp. TSF1-S3]
MTLIDLQRSTVLVTGASRGIGAAIARTLHGAGAAVILHYSQGEAEARQVVAELADGSLGQDDQRTHLVQADLAVPGAARSLWRQSVAWRGSVSAVVNNAATMPAASVAGDWEQWSAAWQATLQVNLVAMADLCREAIAHFQAQGGGTLVNLASRAAFRGDGPEFMAYAASKGGVIGLTRTIAKGFAAEGVRAYAIAPGFVRTDRIEQVMAERGAEYVTRDIPMGAPAEPQDIANLVAFLVAGLAPHATGATFDVNGASYFH